MIKDNATVTTLAKNVLGSSLQLCCGDPKTGFFRDGYCHTHNEDQGHHWVCAVMNNEYLQFSLKKGNDLTTPNPLFHFPGLKPGDCWCVCANEWFKAFEVGLAPSVKLLCTHQRVLDFIPIEALKKHAVV